mmetsp:Transcript_3642/g.5336  ORF Transcript_3642/g.5336 Transcript_3642/m.5336 type:complete len:124 (-) Transcript_3642:201-572(-)
MRLGSHSTSRGGKYTWYTPIEQVFSSLIRRSSRQGRIESMEYKIRRTRKWVCDCDCVSETSLMTMPFMMMMMMRTRRIHLIALFVAVTGDIANDDAISFRNSNTKKSIESGCGLVPFSIHERQ